MPRPSRPSDFAAILPDVLPEDRLLWQFWVNKGMEEAPLRACLAALSQAGPAANWNYIAGNAMYGGFEEALLRAVRRFVPEGALPGGFLEQLRHDVAGSTRPVTPATPEGKLLTLCASPRMTVPEDEQARALAAGRVRWSDLVASAARANVTAAVQHNLARLELDARMPEDLAGLLADRARGIVSRNQRVLAMLDELGAVLRAEGLRVLLLKESALALSHYGDGRLRMMGDIDLLLEPAEIERVVAMLEARGYQSAEVLWTKEHYRRRHHHAAPLVHPELAIKIEPHHGIGLPELPGGPPAGLVEAMAARSVRLDAHTWCFTPADTLFHLCLDLFGNAFIGKMGQLCDAREVIRQGGVEWAHLEALARSTSAEAHIAFSLGLLHNAGAGAPADLIGRLEAARRPPFAARALRAMARRNLLGWRGARARMTRPGEKLRFQALMLPGGPAKRAAYVIRRYLYLGESEEGVGELARRERPGRSQALGRLLALPLRVLKRWTASRRMP